jgi:hypothetical protein
MRDVQAPGLVKREVIGFGPDYVDIREVWDLSVPNCPMVAVRLLPFEINKDAKNMERTIREPRHIPTCKTCGKTPENIGWCDLCGFNRNY